MVIIDRTYTETAQFGMAAISDGDAYLLLSLLQVMFARTWWTGVPSPHFADRLDWLRAQAASFDPEVTRTGIDPATVRQLAGISAASRRPRSTASSVPAWYQPDASATLIDVVNLVAGQLDQARRTSGAPEAVRHDGDGRQYAFRRKQSTSAPDFHR